MRTWFISGLLIAFLVLVDSLPIFSEASADENGNLSPSEVTEAVKNNNTEVTAIWKQFAQVANQRYADTQLILEHFKTFQREMSQKIDILEQKFDKEVKKWRHEKEKKQWDGEIADIIHNGQASIASSAEEEANVLGSKEAVASGVKNAEDDEADTSEQQTAPNGTTDDVWTLEQGLLYRWKNWNLIRAEDSLLIWCDAIILELRDSSNGYIHFFMNGRQGTYYFGAPTALYYEDDEYHRTEFPNKLRDAKAAVPSGAQTKTILSFPRASKTIKFGNWDLSSVETGTMLVTNLVFNDQLTIKEKFIDQVLHLLVGQY